MIMNKATDFLFKAARLLDKQEKGDKVHQLTMHIEDGFSMSLTFDPDKDYLQFYTRLSVDDAVTPQRLQFKYLKYDGDIDLSSEENLLRFILTSDKGRELKEVLDKLDKKSDYTKYQLYYIRCEEEDYLSPNWVNVKLNLEGSDL